MKKFFKEWWPFMIVLCCIHALITDMAIHDGLSTLGVILAPFIIYAIAGIAGLALWLIFDGVK